MGNDENKRFSQQQLLCFYVRAPFATSPVLGAKVELCTMSSCCCYLVYPLVSSGTLARPRHALSTQSARVASTRKQDFANELLLMVSSNSPGTA